MVKFPQYFVGIAGKECPTIVKDVKAEKIQIQKLPKFIELKKISQINNDAEIILSYSSEISTPSPYFITTISLDGKIFEIPTRVFGEREFFVTFVLQSNVHSGWDPRDMRQYIEEFRGKNAPKYRQDIGTQGGPEISGNAFIHHIGDEEQIQKLGEKYRYKPLEAIFHDKKIPISWLIDYNVAEEYKPKFLEWREKYQDSIGYLPPSYFHHNHFSYNYKKTQTETTDFLRNIIEKGDHVFEKDNNTFYSNWGGIDQWVGSIGTHFVHAAMELGLEGLWGMGWDHRSCDTSMYHRGAPWNAYKPSKEQFRAVMKQGEKANLWLYQWTVRDLVNTLPISPYGSVCFSTDADDVKSQEILYLERDPTYWWKLLQDYKTNYEEQQLQHFIFLVHQEDHDAHIKDDNDFIELFVNEVVDAINTGEKLTLATLYETTAWLNLRYKADESNTQYLELHDPLEISTRKEIQHKYFMSIARIYDPDEEDEIQELLDEHWPGDRKIGTTLAYFDQKSLWLARFLERIPKYHYNYLDPKQKDVDEQGELVMTKIPQLSKIEETFSSTGYHLKFDAKNALPNVPWILWKKQYKEEEITQIPQESIFQEGKEAMVLLIDIKKGENDFKFGK